MGQSGCYERYFVHSFFHFLQTTQLKENGDDKNGFHCLPGYERTNGMYQENLISNKTENGEISVMIPNILSVLQNQSGEYLCYFLNMYKLSIHPYLKMVAKVGIK